MKKLVALVLLVAVYLNVAGWYFSVERDNEKDMDHNHDDDMQRALTDLHRWTTLFQKHALDVEVCDGQLYRFENLVIPSVEHWRTLGKHSSTIMKSLPTPQGHARGLHHNVVQQTNHGHGLSGLRPLNPFADFSSFANLAREQWGNISFTLSDSLDRFQWEDLLTFRKLCRIAFFKKSKFRLEQAFQNAARAHPEDPSLVLLAEDAMKFYKDVPMLLDDDNRSADTSSSSSSSFFDHPRTSKESKKPIVVNMTSFLESLHNVTAADLDFYRFSVKSDPRIERRRLHQMRKQQQRTMESDSMRGQGRCPSIPMEWNWEDFLSSVEPYHRAGDLFGEIVLSDESNGVTPQRNTHRVSTDDPFFFAALFQPHEQQRQGLLPADKGMIEKPPALRHVMNWTSRERKMRNPLLHPQKGDEEEEEVSFYTVKQLILHSLETLLRCGGDYSDIVRPISCTSYNLTHFSNSKTREGFSVSLLAAIPTVIMMEILSALSVDTETDQNRATWSSGWTYSLQSLVDFAMKRIRRSIQHIPQQRLDPSSFHVFILDPLLSSLQLLRYAKAILEIELVSSSTIEQLGDLAIQCVELAQLVQPSNDTLPFPPSSQCSLYNRALEQRLACIQQKNPSEHDKQSDIVSRIALLHSHCQKHLSSVGELMLGDVGLRSYEQYLRTRRHHRLHIKEDEEDAQQEDARRATAVREMIDSRFLSFTKSFPVDRLPRTYLNRSLASPAGRFPLDIYSWAYPPGAGLLLETLSKGYIMTNLSDTKLRHLISIVAAVATQLGRRSIEGTNDTNRTATFLQRNRSGFQYLPGQTRKRQSVDEWSSAACSIPAVISHLLLLEAHFKPQLRAVDAADLRSLVVELGETCWAMHRQQKLVGVAPAAVLFRNPSASTWGGLPSSTTKNPNIMEPLVESNYLASGALEPFLFLYHLTGDATYKRRAEYIVREMVRAAVVSPSLLSSASQRGRQFGFASIRSVQRSEDPFWMDVTPTWWLGKTARIMLLLFPPPVRQRQYRSMLSRTLYKRTEADGGDAVLHQGPALASSNVHDCDRFVETFLCRTAFSPFAFLPFPVLSTRDDRHSD